MYNWTTISDDCGGDKIKEKLIKQGVCDLLVAALETFHEVEEGGAVLPEATAAIGNLANDLEIRSLFGENGACKYVVLALKHGIKFYMDKDGTSKDVESVRRWSSYAIGQIAADNDDNKGILANFGACEALVTALRGSRCGRDEEDLWTACLNLAEDHDGNRTRFGTKGLVGQAVNALRRQIKIGPRKDLVDMIALILDVMKQLAYIEDNRKIMMKEELPQVVEELVAIVSAWEGPKKLKEDQGVFLESAKEVQGQLAGMEVETSDREQTDKGVEETKEGGGGCALAQQQQQRSPIVEPPQRSPSLMAVSQPPQQQQPQPHQEQEASDGGAKRPPADVDMTAEPTNPAKKAKTDAEEGGGVKTLSYLTDI